MIDFETNIAKANQKEQQSIHVHDKKINLGILFVGLLCIIFGIIYFYSASHLSAIKLQVSYAQIWPLSLIAIGLALFAARSKKTITIGLIITILAVLTTGSTVLLKDDFIGRKDTIYGVEKSPSVSRGSINIDHAAGKLIVQGGISNRLLDAFYESNYASFKPNQSQEGETQIIHLSQSDLWHGVGNYYKNLTTRLSTEIPMSLQVSGTALDATLDLSDVQIENFDLDLQASDATLTFGSGVDNLNVTVNAVASSVTIIYPPEIGVEIIPLGTVSRENLQGFRKTGDGIMYRSNTYESSSKKSRLSLTHTVSRITVIQQ